MTTQDKISIRLSNDAQRPLLASIPLRGRETNRRKPGIGLRVVNLSFTTD